LHDDLPTVSDLFGFLAAKETNNGWWRCRCPAHESRWNSLTLALRAGDTVPVVFHCHAGCTFEAITEQLERMGVWPVQHDLWYRPPPQDEAFEESARKWFRLVDINKELMRARGSRVEKYLNSRAITLLPESEIFYHPRLWHDFDHREWPAMVAGIHDVSGKVIGVHRTYLRYDRPGKAPVDPYSPKLSLKYKPGGAAHLGEAGPVLVIAEGIENALSVSQRTGLPSWAALGTNMVNIDLPDIVQEVLIAADGDAAGRDAARRAGYRWQRLGKRVRIMEAPAGHDWNDVLRGAAQ
jgi:putative DNA primase/helicase